MKVYEVQYEVIITNSFLLAAHDDEEAKEIVTAHKVRLESRGTKILSVGPIQEVET